MVQGRLRSGDQILEEAEEGPLFLGSATSSHSHWADNVLVTHFGELVFVQTRDPHLWVVRLGESQSDAVTAKLVDQGIVLRLPLCVNGFPLLHSKFVDVGGDAVVFPSANKMPGEVAAGVVPICAQLVEVVHIAHHWHVRFRRDGKIGVAELIGPFVIGIG